MPDIRTTLKRVADIGYTAVQVSGFGPVDHKDVARAVEDNGLIIAATHISWDQCIQDVDAVIAQHKLWDCVHPAIGGLAGEYHTADGIKRFLDELKPVAERLAAEGMDFSYHNHAHELEPIGDSNWLEMLYNEADPSVLKAELDLYWLQHGGADPVAWLRQCAGRQPLCHFKDMRITDTDEKQFAEVGEGILDWPAIIAAAGESGVEWALVEQDNCYGKDPFECLATSYRNLKKLGLS